MKPITRDMLVQMGATAYDANKYVAYFNKYLPLFKINNLDRVAQLMAQLFHESIRLNKTREVANGLAYEFRKDLGNFRKGDGPLFKGRALIQITGADNYKTVTAIMRKMGFIDETVDFFLTPQLLESPEWAVVASLIWWQNKWYRGMSMYELSDRKMAVSVSKAVNGGTNGLSDRLMLADRAYTVFAPLFS